MSEASEKKSPYINLYEGNEVDIWIDEDDSIITLAIGAFTVALPEDVFTELSNAIIIAKHQLKELKSHK